MMNTPEEAPLVLSKPLVLPPLPKAKDDIKLKPIPPPRPSRLSPQPNMIALPGLTKSDGKPQPPPRPRRFTISKDKDVTK